MKTLFGILLICTSLSACTSKQELPSNSGSGADLMRSSPCACNQIDYDGSGFKWRG